QNKQTEPGRTNQNKQTEPGQMNQNKQMEESLIQQPKPPQRVIWYLNAKSGKFGYYHREKNKKGNINNIVEID
ncbi:44739_t:CDS:2, partial [Gigaspora margarita]